MEKLWIYIKQIWNRENGLHMPELLEKAPYVMKCEIMREIYSIHLRRGYLFKVSTPSIVENKEENSLYVLYSGVMNN